MDCFLDKGYFMSTAILYSSTTVLLKLFNGKNSSKEAKGVILFFWML